MYPNNKCNTSPTDPCAEWCLKPSENDLHQELECFWKKFLAPKVDQMLKIAYDRLISEIPDTALADAFLSNILIYEDCNDDHIFDCKAIILYEGRLLKSKIKDNDRHPDDTHSWEEIGSLASILAKFSEYDDMSLVKIPYHRSCSGSSNCKSVYSYDELIALKVDTGNVDDCGQPVYVDEYYISIEDKNDSTPSPNSEEWNGPLNPHDLFKLNGCQ